MERAAPPFAPRVAAVLRRRQELPYGDKTREQVTEAVDFAVRRLVDRGVKLIVVACNAATAMAIDHLRAAYPIPFVGLEPAVKPAALSSRSGVIGILATAATLRGKLFRETSRRYEDRVRIIARVGEGFVELVEQNRERTEEAYRRVERLLTPMIEAGADRIVLGCTHYPFLSEAMHRVIGDRDVRLVNPAAAVEQRTETLLCEGGIEASGGSRPVYEFMTSADEAYRQRLGRQERGSADDAFRVGGAFRRRKPSGEAAVGRRCRAVSCFGERDRVPISEVSRMRGVLQGAGDDRKCEVRKRPSVRCGSQASGTLTGKIRGRRRVGERPLGRKVRLSAVAYPPGQR